MEDTSQFINWATNPGAAADHEFSEAAFPSLQALREASHAAEMVQELIAGVHAPNSWSSDNGDGAANNNLPASWNFGATSAQQPGSNGMMEAPAASGLPDLVYEPPPTRRAGGLRSMGSMSASYAQDHIMAERKRREKINTRFVELSTVIPGLKKMDKATILSDATRYVKELQEKLKDLEAGGSGGRSIETRLVLVKRPYLHAAADDGSPLLSSASPGTPTAARKELPEIEVRFSEKSVMVRVHCENSKGVAVKVLTEIEKLQLTIIHANVMPFLACSLIIDITAKASFSSPFD
ncbi:Transcription factor bHLH25 [Dichanthelium oligosanthes]|uniref:Transcription factor bHLH25 n=1 Tax=Dichanthelium oligosanthes TaxID=888268 RepID=A0A1E5VY27_9POAL|nr:Transcription factor bHLH25 [Dichanthelium oligosanthes]